MIEEKEKSTTIRVTKKCYEKIRRQAFEKGMFQGDFIEAVVDYIKKNKVEIK